MKGAEYRGLAIPAHHQSRCYQVVY